MHAPALLVLAGGTSRRWGGHDKTAAQLGDRPVLACTVAAALVTRPALVVVVAPADHPARPVLERTLADVVPLAWTREDPPGGGPVAGLAAGLRAVDPELDVVCVLAGDLPFAGPALPRLLAALLSAGATGTGGVPPPDGVVGVDPQGRRQWLLGAYRTAALRAAVEAAVTGTATGGGRSGPAVRDVVGALELSGQAVDASEALDLDTPDDLVTAQRVLAERSRP